MGANTTGLDACEDLIKMAKLHAQAENLTSLEYVVSSIEDHCKNNVEKYDAVVASEVIEHVSAKEDFLNACIKCLKPKGSVFITTINKTQMASWIAIFFAENVLGIIPKGTHHYDKLIEPHRIQKMLDDSKFTFLIYMLFYYFIYYFHTETCLENLAEHIS